MAAKVQVASAAWVEGERIAVVDMLREESEELRFPVLEHLEWLNEHLSGLLSSSAFNDLQPFKTPARLRGAKTPRTVKQTAIKHVPKPVFTSPVVAETRPAVVEDIAQVARQSSPLQLYSDLGSPSAVSESPERPTVRKGSFTFAALPARETFKRSVSGAPQDPEERTARHSLGLDSDDEDDDHESVDLRAPELIAHEQRMEAYETSPVHPVQKSPEPLGLPGAYPEIEQPISSPLEPRRSSRRSSAKRKADALDSSSEDQTVTAAEERSLRNERQASIHEIEPTDTVDEVHEKAKEPIARHSVIRPTTADRSRIRVPSKLGGRPVRPTAVAAAKAKQPAHVAIKIKPLGQPKPVNTAPVAAHNQEQSQAEPPKRPELQKKPSAQSMHSTFSKSTSKAPTGAAKALSTAQKKKELDEKAAARDALIKQQQKDRRDQKIEELRQKKREEELERDRKAHEATVEQPKKHTVDIDDREAKRQKAEERQEREQAAADAKKAAFREMQKQRQMRPAVVPPSSKPQNPPPRPPTRMDLHEDMTAEEDTPPRLGAPVRQPSLQRQQPPEPELPSYSNNLNRPPVRVSQLNKFPQPPRAPPAHVPQMQHLATGKIPFAQTPMQSMRQIPQSQHTQQQSRLQPPAPMQHMQIVHDTSPMSLPEIHTDSSDDSDRDVSLPSWATPGHIFNMLSHQETINPDSIFPAMRPISIDDVFAENPDRLRRLRMRTSSANWIRTGDALNQVEIIEDRIGRQAIRNAGGWVYNAGQ